MRAGGSSISTLGGEVLLGLADQAGRLTATYSAAGLLNLILALTFTQTGADAAAFQPLPHGRDTLAEHKRTVTAAVAAILAS